MNWTKWRRFKDDELADIPSKSGVYQFRCVNKNGKPLLIQRLRKKDPEGIVYIGQSKNLHNRIKGFWVTVKKKDSF
jgi:excinuclease UvrABC nuclease subunit